jgi:hypothetical protein
MQLFFCVSSGAALLSLEHAQLKANSIGIDVLAAAHGLLVAYYGRTELWTMREMKKVFVVEALQLQKAKCRWRGYVGARQPAVRLEQRYRGWEHGSVRGRGLCPRVLKRVRWDGTWLAVTSFGD